MSHDLDEAIRHSLRRHAEDAPGTLDLARVRLRSKDIARRRTLEAIGAMVVLLGVVVGLGLMIGTLRHDAAPPPPVTAPPVPGGAPALAFVRTDAAVGPAGSAAVVVRAGGVESVVYQAQGAGVTLVGWYGVDHRTLVWGVGNDGVSSRSLYSARFDSEGVLEGGAAPMSLPDVGEVNGAAFARPGGGFVVWVPPSGADERPTLILVSDDLRSSRSERFQPSGHPLFATDTVLALVGSGLQDHVSFVDLATARTVLTATFCLETASSFSAEKGLLAVGCTDGQVEVVSATTAEVSSLGVLPESTSPGSLLGFWWDPAGGVHAATATAAGDVHDWDWTGTSWLRASADGTLRRVHPVSGPSIRLQQERASASSDRPRWIVESSPEVDLGPTDGSLVVAPVAALKPTPEPTGSRPAAALGWTATVRSVGGGTGRSPAEQVWVSIGGHDVMVDDAGNQATSVLGWYGPDHRTLVWQTGQDLLQLRAVAFAADGSVDGAPHDLEVPGVSSPLLGMATPIPGRGLVLWHQKPGTAPPGYEMVRLDDGLTLHSTTPDDGGSLVFATGTTYATTETVKQPTESILLSRDGTTTPVRLLRNCAGDLSGVASLDGSRVALMCRGSAAGQQNHVELFDLAANRADDSVLPAGDAVLWWDPAGDLHASVDGVPVGGASSPTTVRWVLSAGSWIDDPDQTADLRVFPMEGPSLRWTREGGASASGSWTAETDPSLTLGPGLPSPAYDIGTGNIAVRPTA